MANSPSTKLAPALLELQKLAQKRPTLAAACEVLSNVLPAIFAEQHLDRSLQLTSEQIDAKLSAGIPLLRGESVPVDEAALARRWMAICTALRQDAADALARVVEKGALEPGALLRGVLAVGPQSLLATVESLGLDYSLAATVLRMAALPELASIARSLGSAGSRWDHGYCPLCGSWPLLGEARGLEQERFLRCGMCAIAWPCGRLYCPYCENRDYQTLGYLHVEGEEDRHRAGTCDVCQGYVKWVSTIFALTEPQLFVADLATMHLDLAAAERDFIVPN